MLTKPYYGRIFFNADDGNDGSNGEKPEGNKPDGNPPPDPEGFKPITSESELSAWKGRTKKAMLEEVRSELRAELERDQAARDAAAEQKRKDDEAIARGEFDKVRSDLESKLTAADTGKQALADKLARVEERAAKRVETMKAGLPAEALEDFPADADALTQETWLEDRAALVAKLAPAAQSNGHPRVPETPKPNAPANGITKEQQAAIDRQYRNF